MQVIIHAHLYQPPRENPWTGQIPRQESAHPAHDWNVRVTDECYRPNARSRLMGARNLIEEIVNNYAYTSFDFGPTLLTWLERHSPGVYEQIIEGDRWSVRMQGGHGNAIAHVYNHMIMPLANYRDKITQIVWGLRDFEWRFQRKSESIWLAETAINLETVKLLIDHGVRYVILSPYQALRTRPLDRSRGWTDAAGGKIDPRYAYRYFVKDVRRRRLTDSYIDVFFYDGPLAADVSFAHLLRSAPSYADRLQLAAAGLPPGEGQVNVATDGEVYGHHEPFGDMCLSYLVRREGPRRGIEFTNYGRFLELHPPTQEVDLNFGEQDEGTAWSCAHGVGRWERDCGCSTGGREGWNQRWRTPLRRGFDMVRDRLVETFLEAAGPLVRDPWAVRDDYVLVLLDPSRDARNGLLQQHARRDLGPAERRQLWSLLESQRYAMYMYTSCGWFFADISGIETVQNMAYACRAIELARPWQRLDLEEMLLDYLAEAHSNIPELGSGADVYQRFVHPQRLRPVAVAGGVAIGAAVLDRPPESRQFRHQIRTLRLERQPADASPGENGATGTTGPNGSNSGTPPIWHGLLEITHLDTEESLIYAAHIYHDGPGELRCYVVPCEAGEAGADAIPLDHPAEADLKGQAGVEVYSLRDLVAEDREQIIRTAFESILRAGEDLLAQLFEQGQELIATCRDAGVDPPPVLRAAAGHVLTRRLGEKAVLLESSLRSRGCALCEDPAGPGAPARTEDSAPADQEQLLQEIAGLLNYARESELEVSIDALVQAYGRVIRDMLEALLAGLSCTCAQRCEEVIRSSYDLHFPLDRRPLEDLAYRVLWKNREALRAAAQSAVAEDQRCWRAYQALAEALHLNIRWILEQENGSPPGSLG
jgi:alpha-amylase/alpha-mannosidase (GH57 family)